MSSTTTEKVWRFELEKMFRLFIANAKGTFFGMSESLEASSRHWNSRHVPYDSTNTPEKIYIPHIPNSNMPNAKWIKEKGRSPVDPQVPSKGAKREKVRAGRKPKQTIFQGADIPRKARGLKDRVRRIFVQARVAKGQRCNWVWRKYRGCGPLMPKVIVP